MFSRRSFLKLIAGSTAWLYTRPRVAAAKAYRVGVGHTADPYEATIRAVQASAEWPVERLAGRTAVIKPNLVSPKTSETGLTTDPQVVRALVDLALAAGAARVLIVEAGSPEAYFAACGYEFFQEYDPEGRVALVDLGKEPFTLVDVPDGMAYEKIYMPELLLTDHAILISAAKLKTHINSFVTLSMKNLFGLPPVPAYQNSRLPGRFAMHDRGVNQTIVDLNLVRPIDYAVVDGIWGMEGNGPLRGDPIKMDLVVAGRNALAVDRTCLLAMGISQDRVQHLAFAAASGLGPADMAEIEVAGDPLPARAFAPPKMAPQVDGLTCWPRSLAVGAGQRVRITWRLDRAARVRVRVLRTWDDRPEVEVVRVLQDWRWRLAGRKRATWDGLDEEGQPVPAGRYTIQVSVDTGRLSLKAHYTTWIVMT